MTEAEWLAYRTPMYLFNYLEQETSRRNGLASGRSERAARFVGWIRTRFRRNDYWSRSRVHRRLYLLACAANRAWWAATTEGSPIPPRFLMEERFAEGELTLEQLLADDPERRWWWPNPWHLVSNVFRRGCWKVEYGDVFETYTALTRDIFGNPFRHVTVDPSWLTSTVLALAAGIYDERAFDRLPILADALQDAGCDHPDILDHCRCDGPHARGCWVVDLVLGKS